MPLPDYRMPLATPKTPNFADSIKAMYEPRNQQTQLLGKELENIFNEIRNRTAHEKNKADIGYTRAQTGLAQAHTGQVGAQTGLLNAQLPYAGQMAQYQAQQEQLKTERAQALAPILMEAFEAMRNQQQGIGQPQQAQMQQEEPQFMNVPHNATLEPPAVAQNVSPSAPIAQQQQAGNRLQQMLQTPGLGDILARELGIPSQQQQSLTGLPAEAASLARVLNDANIPDHVKQGLMQDFENRRNVQQGLGASRAANVENLSFRLLPADSKTNVLAGYAALGIEEKQAIDLFNQGLTPAKYAQEALGFSPEEARALDKQYPATSATRTAIQATEGAVAEEEYLGPLVSEALAPYAQKFAGYSPQQIKDSFSNDPNKTEKLARFYAARALQPEISGIRARMAGGSSAHEALRDIQSASLNEIKVFDPQISPEVYKKAQGYISDWLGGATRARVGAMKGNKSKHQENSGRTFTIRNRKTGESKTVTADEAKKMGININE